MWRLVAAAAAVSLLVPVACSSSHHPTATASPGQAASGARIASPDPTWPNPPCPPTGSGYASGARTAAPPAPPSPSPVPAGTGSIKGRLSYPSEVIIPQLVYAISTSGTASGAYSVETVWDQPTYTILGVRPGTYFVYTTPRPIRLNPYCWSVLGAGYTNAVACGLKSGCDDHRPVRVAVTAGQVTVGIDVSDWYGTPTYSVPAPPPSVVPDEVWTTPHYDAAFSTPDQAFADYLPGRSQAFLAGAIRSGCPTNRACLSMAAPRTGTAAAYVTAQVGSNSDVLDCVFLVYQDTIGWHMYASQRCRLGSAFPAVGSTGPVWLGIGAAPTDCLRVHTQPGVSTPVVSCLGAGTTVTVDGGPEYVPPATGQYPQDGFWWHLQNRGWVNDFFLNS